MDHDHLGHQAHKKIPEGAKTATDPVCGMTVEVKEDTRSETYDGKSYHFCSAKCQEKFKADPWFYASGNA
ncbi:MAG: YHS domain-containing protein, partial [Paracoccaceae bacterium]